MNKLILLLAIVIYTWNSIVVASEFVEYTSTEKQTVMIELFTSQGCSSCPPAERWLNSYAQDEKLWSEIIPIAFHVDYWDKLGWPDVFANKAYSARQYRHRQQNNIRSVYTPGIVVNGNEWRGWTRGNAFPELTESAGILSFKASEKKVSVNYSRPASNIVLNVALLGVGLESKIDRGENRNKVLKQEFVALSHDVYPASNGGWTISLPKDDKHNAKKYALAIWVSNATDISPIQATGYWIPSEWVKG